VSPSTQDGIKRLFGPRAPHISEVGFGYTTQKSTRVIGSYNPNALVTFPVVERSQGVNAPGFDGNATLLHLASRRAHVEFVQSLLYYGADANA